MKILFHIFPAEDGVHCGRCPSIKSRFSLKCKLFGRNLIYEGNAMLRLPECLAAEQAAKEEREK